VKRTDVGLALASVVLTLLTVEVLVRMAGLAAPHTEAAARLVDPRWRELLDCYPSNPRGYFDLDLRDAATRERFQYLAPMRYDVVKQRAPFAVASRYNTLRFRDEEPAPKRPGRRRVAVVGDSFTEGQGVKETDTLARRLEALLNGQAQPSWDVRNCGRRGLDFPALVDGFDAALTLDPDVVVYAMTLNDPVRTPEFGARQRYVNDWIMDRGQPRDEAPSTLRWYHSRLAGFVRGRLGHWRIGRETTRWYLDMYSVPNREGWAQTRVLMRDMQRRARARGARFVLVLWPLLVGTDGAYPFTSVHEEVRRFCLAEGIEELDLLQALHGRAPRDLWVHEVDMHPNELAHRLAAEAVAPVLTAETGASR
jgi:lysophospholipase L1-like esterase